MKNINTPEIREDKIMRETTKLEVKRVCIRKIKPRVTEVINAQLGIYLDTDEPKLNIIATNLVALTIDALLPIVESVIDQEVRELIRRMI
jgi:hypothetical protein